MAQLHIGVGKKPAAFSVIAGRAGCHYIRPGVGPTQVARDDVVYGQVESVFPAVLAGIAIPPENLTAG